MGLFQKPSNTISGGCAAGENDRLEALRLSNTPTHADPLTVIPAQAGIQEFAAQAGIQEFAAQAGIQEFDERTESRLAPGRRRLCAYINAYAAKRLSVLKAPSRRSQIKLPALPGVFDCNNLGKKNPFSSREKAAHRIPTFRVPLLSAPT